MTPSELNQPLHEMPLSEPVIPLVRDLSINYLCIKYLVCITVLNTMEGNKRSTFLKELYLSLSKCSEVGNL